MLILFDLDGTLLDTLADLRRSVNLALRAFGYPERSLEQIRCSVGSGFRHLVSTSLPEGCEEVEAVLAEARRQYALHFCDETRPYEGILPLLQQLKEEGHSLAIVSNKPDNMVQALWQRFFSETVCYAAGEISGLRRKPAADGVFRAIEQLAGDKNHAVYVGDSDVDVLTANNAGLPCLCVTWGFRTPEELRRAGAQQLCSDVQELYRCICALSEK